MKQRQRINLLIAETGHPAARARSLTYVASALFMIAAVFNLIDYDVEGTDLARHIILSTTYFLAALLFFFKIRFELSDTSKYAPHFIISQDGFKIKTGILNKSQFIEWNNIKKIELGRNKVGVKMNEAKSLIYYQHPAHNKSSVEKTKGIIEAVAASKGAEVKKIS